MSYLIYLNELGPNYKGDNIYEFIFSDSLEDVWGESWESNPANGYPQPPDLELISKVAVLKNDKLKFNVIQNSDYFSMIDCKDDIISLGWEIENEFVNYSINKRLSFRVGESEEIVNNKLYERDIVLEFEKKITYESK